MRQNKKKGNSKITHAVTGAALLLSIGAIYVMLIALFGEALYPTIQEGSSYATCKAQKTKE